MTTILACPGMMVADSSITNGDRVWIGRKVWRIKGALLGFSGDCLEAEQFVKWFKAGCVGKPPKFSGSECLVLDSTGLTHYLETCTPSPVQIGIEAIGTGAKAAMCAFEAMGHADPKRAVQIVCRHDAHSRPPVRVYHL